MREVRKIDTGEYVANTPVQSDQLRFVSSRGNTVLSRPLEEEMIILSEPTPQNTLRETQNFWGTRIQAVHILYST